MSHLAAVPPPDPPIHLLMPLASSLLYVVAALSLKRASDERAGVWRSTFVMNLMAAGFFGVVPLVAAAGPGPAALWQPAVVAVLFVGGQAATMYALNRGDVSIATPVVGTKVVFVAFFVTLLVGDRLGADLWASAGMSAAGIALLNRGTTGEHRHVGRTIVASLLAAACYALFDTLVRMWAGSWGTARLLAVAMAMAAAGSLAFVPAFEGPLRQTPRAAVRPLLVGAAVLSFQSVVLTAAIGLYTDTPRINVVYNARGLWSVLAVWLVGHWFGNRERRDAGRGAFRWRLAGAVLMLGAILVAILQPLAYRFGV